MSNQIWKSGAESGSDNIRSGSQAQNVSYMTHQEAEASLNATCKKVGKTSAWNLDGKTSAWKFGRTVRAPGSTGSERSLMAALPRQPHNHNDNHQYDIITNNNSNTNIHKDISIMI